jgi:hypothetical protein
VRLGGTVRTRSTVQYLFFLLVPILYTDRAGAEPDEGLAEAIKQIQANSSKFKQIQANSSKFKQIQASKQAGARTSMKYLPYVGADGRMERHPIHWNSIDSTESTHSID